MNTTRNMTPITGAPTIDINGQKFLHGWDQNRLYHCGVEVANNLARYALKRTGSRAYAEMYLRTLMSDLPEWEDTIFLHAVSWLPIFSV